MADTAVDALEREMVERLEGAGVGTPLMAASSIGTALTDG